MNHGLKQLARFFEERRAVDHLMLATDIGTVESTDRKTVQVLLATGAPFAGQS